MENHVEKMIAYLEKENSMLEINIKLMGDNDGQIFQSIAENEHVLTILRENY